MPDDGPLVTVLMGVRDGADSLPAALASLRSQSFGDFELLIIDDGSTDDTPRILAEFHDARVRIVRQPALGLTRALNKGLELARGTYVARMDADDVCHPQRLASQVALLQGHPDVALCGTWAHVVDDQGRRLELSRPPVEHAAICAQLLWDNAFFHSSWMVRTETVRRLGGYDDTLERAQDYELAWRISGVARCANIPVPLLTWRRSVESVTVRHREAQRRSVGDTSFRALTQATGRRIDADWFWRLRELWDGGRVSLPPGDGHRLAALIRDLPAAAALTSWVDLIAIVAAARRQEAAPVLAAAWSHLRGARARLIHPKRLFRVALGPSGLRASAALRKTLRGY